jgi:hypothetical protein
MAGISTLQRKFREKRQNYQFMSEIADKFQEQLLAIYQHLLEHPTRDAHIEQLEALSNKFFELKEELSLVNAGSDLMAKCDYLIFRYSKDILEMMEAIGSAKCSNILKMVLGDDYHEQVNEHEWLDLYERVFVPQKFRIKEKSSNRSLVSGQSKNARQSLSAQRINCLSFTELSSTTP